MRKILLLAIAGIVWGVPATTEGADLKQYRIEITDVNGPPVPGVSGNEVSRYGNDGNWELTERLWKTYGGPFNYSDWVNAKPDSYYKKIVLVWEDKKIVLISQHPILEQDANLVMTSRGVQSLNGRSRADVLKSDDPGYVRKREAFDGIIAECVRLEEKFKAEKPLRERRLLEYEEQQRKKTPSNWFGPILMASFLFLLSLLWSGPALLCRALTAKRGRSTPAWLFLMILFSPLGWASILSLTYVRAWMIPLSIATPLVCALFLKILPARPNASVPTKSWWLILTVLVYGFLNVRGGSQYIAMTTTAGSSESGSVGNLNSIRSALSIYYADYNGAYPPELSSLAPKYLSSLPEVQAISRDKIIIHPPSRRVTLFRTRMSDDRGGWGYVNEPQMPDGKPNPDFGSVYINCTHSDLQYLKRMNDY